MRARRNAAPRLNSFFISPPSFPRIHEVGKSSGHLKVKPPSRDRRCGPRSSTRKPTDAAGTTGRGLVQFARRLPNGRLPFPPHEAAVDGTNSLLRSQLADGRWRRRLSLISATAPATHRGSKQEAPNLNPLDQCLVPCRCLGRSPRQNPGKACLRSMGPATPYHLPSSRVIAAAVRSALYEVPHASVG